MKLLFTVFCSRYTYLHTYTEGELDDSDKQNAFPRAPEQVSPEEFLEGNCSQTCISAESTSSKGVTNSQACVSVSMNKGFLQDVYSRQGVLADASPLNTSRGSR